MKSALLLAALAATTLTARVASAEDGTTDAIEDVQVYTKARKPDLWVKPGKYYLEMKDFVFPSGLRIIMQADHSAPIVAVTSVIDRGSTADPVGKEGIAHFVEHLWFRSQHGDLPKVWDILGEIGCSLNASTAADWTNYMSVCPADHFETLMRLESLRLTAAVHNVEPGVVDIEREVIRNELRMRYENTFMMALPHLFDRLYPEGHPYARLGIGSHESLDNIKLEDIVTFAETNYTPANTTIMVVGDFDETRAADFIFENFDPSLLHPRLTQEHIRRFARPGIENLDENNPAHWTTWAIDPDTGTPLELGKPQPRVDAKPPEPPKPATTAPHQVQAAVDDPMVIVAWTLPGAYHGNEGAMNVTANMLGNAMANYLRLMPEVKKDSILKSPEVGCFTWPGKLDTKVMCSATLTDAAAGEQVGEKMLDQARELWGSDAMWSPEMWEQAIGPAFNNSKNGSLAYYLLSVDNYSSITSGRATLTAEHAHYTGSAAYFTDNMNAVMGLDPASIKDYAYKYLTRERAVTLVVEPLPDDERVEKQSGSDYHGADRDSDVVKSTIPVSEISPALIAQATAAPAKDEFLDFKLANGLRVIVKEHGEAPLVESTLVFGGGDYTAPEALDYIQRYHEWNIWNYNNPRAAEHDVMRFAGDWRLNYSGEFTTQGIKASAENLDAQLWLMREMLENRKSTFEGRSTWYRLERRDVKNSWYSAGAWEARLTWEAFAPGHSLATGFVPGVGMNWDHLEYGKKVKRPDLDAYIAQKYQPSNATLLIVGDIEEQRAKALAEGYFDSWQARPGANSGGVPRVPAVPAAPAKKSVYVFDNEKSTQTDVTFVCRIADATSDNRASRQMLGEVLSDEAWKILRERSGVTYGAGAYTIEQPGGVGLLYMNSLVQNRAADFAVTTFYELAGRAEKGEFNHDQLKVLTLNSARQFRLGQQSTDQMTSRLVGTLSRNEPLDRLASWGDALGAVTPQSVMGTMGACTSTNLVFLSGPVKDIGPRLDAAGIAWEEVDTEARGDELYAKYDPKGYAKMMKKRAKDEAKEAAEEAAAPAGETPPAE